MNYLVVILERDMAERCVRRGWEGGRTNGITSTVMLKFPNAVDAMDFAKKNFSEHIWAVEGPNG